MRKLRIVVELYIEDDEAAEIDHLYKEGYEEHSLEAVRKILETTDGEDIVDWEVLQNLFQQKIYIDGKMGAKKDDKYYITEIYGNRYIDVWVYTYKGTYS